jgi:uncharacterized repeat protein (TIGR01451 family)
MKPVKTLILIAFVAVTIAVMGAPQPAVAAAIGTDAGITVTNTVDVDYDVGGVDQTNITATVSFVVDNYVDLTADNGAAPATTGRPNDTNVFYTFTVSNVGNTTQDYGLIAANATTPLAATANTGSTVFTYNVYVEGNGSPGYQAGGDTLQYVDDLPADATTTVYVVTNIPGTAVGGEYRNFSLTAQTRDATGTPGAITAEDPAVDDPAVVQAVFADGAGSSDGPNDGMHSALGAFEVVWTALSVTKTSQVISDPIGGPNPPKAIPGAVVEYTVTVTNNGNLAAENVNVVDPLPAYLTLGTVTISAGVNNSTGNTVDVLLDPMPGSGYTWDVVYEATIQ